MARAAATNADTPRLLAQDEPPAVDVVAGAPEAPVLFLCDHASPRIPRSLGTLGLPADALAKHIAWDIGAADVARHLAEAFGAPLILSGYSRLVIDCNRQLDDPTSIPVISDDIDIPGNLDLTAAQVAARQAAVFSPYHEAIRERLAHLPGGGAAPAVISVHSFTPTFAGFQRPWDVGVLWNRDGRLAEPFMDALGAMQGPAGEEIVVGDNEPYSARENFGYSVDVHAQGRGLPHMLVEIRQDLIGTPQGARRWARVVGAAIRTALKEAGCLS